ncbi:hypothetical protein KDW_10320 [Dictyobacter vulcani]|uniref:Uncharacterized protein n=2 Tax=Dictyobacter vulcani TaxID=2607529 RepID=A0A5J4KKF7_9CHLR|nr:hypothetical protein KDW_10320 [Dictyobacter vulcani]
MAREKVLERTKQQQAYSTFSEDSSSGKWQLSRQASILVSLAFIIMIIVVLVVLYHFYFH